MLTVQAAIRHECVAGGMAKALALQSTSADGGNAKAQFQLA